MSRGLSRRSFLAAAGGSALGVLGVCSLSSCAPSEPSYILATDPEVAQREATRPRSGATVRHRLTAEADFISLAEGQLLGTWGFREDAALAALGPTLRASRGDRLVVDVDNRLTEDTSVHWHGLRIRNDMDGSPPDTQDPILPGSGFTYDFTLPDHGTYWYHSHSGLQADRGLFGALVIEDPDDTSGADTDLVLVLDDWLDGIAATPEQVLAALGPTGGGHGSHGSHGIDVSGEITPTAQELVGQGMGHSDVLGGPTQHIAYPLHLINGRTREDPARLEVPSGSRVRLRVINAAAETPYRIALAGHRLTVIAADGFDTQPFETDAALIAPAQRLDLTVDLSSGVWPFVARVEGREGSTLAVIGTADAAGATPTGARATDIPELDRRLAVDADLRPAEHAALPEREPDQLWRLELIEGTGGYVWGIAGEDAARLQPRLGERIRMQLTNTTSMWHPMHLHGHTFASRTHAGLRRDTIAVLPGETATLDFDADNPGRWMIHCHNAYHFAAGMTAPIRYIR